MEKFVKQGKKEYMRKPAEPANCTSRMAMTGFNNFKNALTNILTNAGQCRFIIKHIEYEFEFIQVPKDPDISVDIVKLNLIKNKINDTYKHFGIKDLNMSVLHTHLKHY